MTSLSHLELQSVAVLMDFSRKWLKGLHGFWLKADKTNNNPKIIAGYLNDAVINAGGYPARLRLDFNGQIAEMQCFSHFSENLAERDSEMQRFSHFSENLAERDSVTFGPSAGNQHTEQWWLILSSECVNSSLD